MCGLAASLGWDNSIAIDMMSYRGTETRHLGNLAHRRLPIVGLGPEGNQPVRVGSSSLAFVGQVLDFRDTDPDEKSDVPTVERAWSYGGPHGLSTRDGFWSVVVAKERELHFFTDYLAQKPLYYRPDLACVASEPNAAASYGPVNPDELYFSDVAKWGYCPDPSRTPYKEVKKTLPGEYVRLAPEGLIASFISDPLVPRRGDLKHEIVEAIRRRVQSSDVPVACLLSGGLDSSIVYTIAKRYGDVKPYFVHKHGDLHWREEYAKALKVAGDEDVTLVAYDDISMAEGLDYMQEPVDLGSLLPQVALARAVEERVCLTGDGADEMFGGYGRSLRYDSQQSDVFRELPCWHLPRLDRVMMRHAVEVRSPFLARRVAEIALGLPRGERTNKKVLRDLFRSDLPPGIADQAKVPLRTSAVAKDREANSIELIKMFKKKVWG